MPFKRSGLMLAASGLALASCSQPNSSHDMAQEESASEPARAPDIRVSAAPGVAFTYDYDFQLPDGAIADAQEDHARACEALGLAKCRITGMNFSIDDDEAVHAHLALKLDPAIAREFGKRAEAIVDQRDGRLINLAIAGDDVGSGIGAAERRKVELRQRIADLETKLAALPKDDEARAAIIAQIGALKDELGGQDRTIEEGNERLATTPMSFDYYGSGGVPGFRANPFREAWLTFIGAIVMIVRVTLQALAVLIPLALLLALFLLLWRSWPVKKARAWFASSGVEPGE